jgi:shikimate dehydrogenase
VKRITSATRLAGVIGTPVRHSLSPVLHNAAYQALDLDWAYVAFEVAVGEAEAAVAGGRALGLVGLSVTTPHKDEAARIATRRSPTVRRLGAANTLTFEKDEVVADSTDGQGFVDDLRVSLDFDVAGRRCGVIGAGGAARAVILALAEAGAKEVLVVNRSPVRAFRAAALARTIGRVVRPEELDAAELVVQATPAEMLKDEATGWPAGADPGRLGSGQLAVDLVYDPPETRWLAEASRCGAATRNGLGMLVHQAGLQVTRWTGQKAPLSAMRAAVNA